MKKYTSPKIEIVTLIQSASLLNAHSGVHDNGHGGENGNPDKGGWKDDDWHNKSKTSNWDGWY